MHRELCVSTCAFLDAEVRDYRAAGLGRWRASRFDAPALIFPKLQHPHRQALFYRSRLPQSHQSSSSAPIVPEFSNRNLTCPSTTANAMAPVQISEVKGSSRENRTAAHSHIKGLGLRTDGTSEKNGGGFVGQNAAREVQTPKDVKCAATVQPVATTTALSLRACSPCNRG